MSLFDSLKSMFASSAAKPDGDKAGDAKAGVIKTGAAKSGDAKRPGGKSADSADDASADGKSAIGRLYSGKALKGKVNIESRFERLRSSVSGTMSSFFVARDRTTDQIVGVKLCDLEKVDFFEARFKGLNKPSEAEIAISMRHPLIVETYETGISTKNEPFLVMEYIDGPTLQKVITDRNEAAVHDSRLKLIRDMAQSLHFVHERGFIHRDICPRNYICLPDYSGLKLIDFGLTVPATPPFMAAGNRTGTPLYMSPEVVRRRPTDKRVDIFSFGVSCYSLCTFELPWQATLTNGRAALHHDSDPPKDILTYRPDLDPRLARAIMQAMSPRVEDRTPSLDLFLRQIQGVTSATV
jgi:serine/threonine-protein kinase